MTKPIALKIPLARPLPPVLGVGAHLKNTLCLIQGQEAWISHDNGPLDTVDAAQNFKKTVEALLDTANEKPCAVAHDWHPDFLCTRWAIASGFRSFGVQHHHAHIAAIMAEHGLDSPVLGLALDGFGLGENKESWGGELLLADKTGFQRLGALRPLKQPGGDLAARQPWRMGAAALWAMGRGGEIASRYAAFHGSAHLSMLMARNLNAPETTSAGRLFDAACGLLGVKLETAFEGEAPMALEKLAAQNTVKIVVDSQDWEVRQGEKSVLDMRPLLARLANMPAVEGAALFHETFAAALLDWLQTASRKTGIKRIALGGGCFLNALLCEKLDRGMKKTGLDPLWPLSLPPGDTAIALGQAYTVALAFEEKERNQQCA